MEVPSTPKRTESTRDQRLQVVTTAWEQICEQFLIEVVDSMPARREAVIFVDGMHTRY